MEVKVLIPPAPDPPPLKEPPPPPDIIVTSTTCVVDSNVFVPDDVWVVTVHFPKEVMFLLPINPPLVLGI
tara:strand:- start:16 stop:225 length:210 start_codon:yes stop_codon:yes gene_type:complete